MVKFILLVLTFTIVPVYSQTNAIDITNNLVNNTQTATAITSTWQGGTFVNSLQCWQPGDPGYCGPNPMVRPTGDINFSYGLGNLNQYINVAKALPYSGNNLVTTGFRFQWTSKNGNSWDDGRLDQLSAYVNLYDKGGSNILESYNYNLNYVHNWTYFDWKQDWNKLRRPNEVSSVQIGFTGMDNNYWAGPYGPEIRDVSFQLKYKPDPCVNNPLYSPDCPKFQEALSKNTQTTSFEPDIKPEKLAEDYEANKSEPIKEQKHEFFHEQEYQPNINIELALNKIFDNQIKEEERVLDVAHEAVLQAENMGERTLKQAESIAKESVARSMQDVVEVKLENTGMQQIQRSNESSFSFFQPPQASTTVVPVFQLPNQLNVLNSRQEKDVSTSTNLQSNVVLGNNLLTTTNSIVRQAATQSTTIQQETLITKPANTMQNIIVAVPTTSIAFRSPQIQSVLIAQESLPNYNVLSPIITQSTTPQLPQIYLPSNKLPDIKPADIVAPVVISIETKPAVVTTVDTPVIQTNFLINPTNPLAQVLETKNLPNTEVKELKQQVNTNSSDSELAQGVPIANIAKVPNNFASYLVALADANFYKPREIYRNQRTVDNNRALQNLRSDQLHQQMINQQWR